MGSSHNPMLSVKGNRSLQKDLRRRLRDKEDRYRQVESYVIEDNSRKNSLKMHSDITSSPIYVRNRPSMQWESFVFIFVVVFFTILGLILLEM